MKTPHLPSARIWRRLAAMVYDGLLLLAINFLVAFAVIGALTPATASHHHQLMVLSASLRYGMILPIVLFTTGLFYSYFWVRNQQTLGMQTWHIKIERWDGALPSWKDALMRYLWSMACFFPMGLGYWWQLFDRDNLALHDRLSRTRIVLSPPQRQATLAKTHSSVSEVHTGSRKK